MTQLTARLDRFEARLRSLETELAELRRLARAEGQTATPPPANEPEPPVWQLLEPSPAPVAPPPRVAPPAPQGHVPGTVPGTRPFRRSRPPLDLSVLLGARALAWTGGAVTLLGVVFFFVLAVDRGWIDPAARVALGAAVSATLVGAGVWVRRRYGDTYASVSSAGAGIAGLYATLLAATALYDLIPAPLALVLAASIAGLGAAVALAWGSETLASLGLLGAMLVPVPVALQDGMMTATGATFACLVLAAATAVAVLRDWRGLLVASVVATAPQALALVADEHPHALAVAVGFWLVYAAGPLWLALRDRISYLSAALLVFSAAFGGWSAGFLFDGRTQGVALLAAASSYAAASTLLFRRERDVASVLWAIALTLAAVGAASLTSGATLTIVWAAEAAVLAWLARRLAEPRFQLASLAWLGLAYAHGLAFAAPLTRLFEANDDAWRAAPSAAALAAATAIVALCTFEWEPAGEGVLARVFARLLDAQPWLRRGALLLAGASAVYAGSLAIVSLPASWDRGHVLVAALWSIVAVALVAAGKKAESLAALGAAVALVLVYDVPQIAEVERSWAFGVVALAAITVAVVVELRSRLELELAAVAAAVTSAALAAAAVLELYGHTAEGRGLLALAAGYALVGVALLRRRRDFASVLGLLSLLLAVPASIELLNGTMLVLAWSAAAAALIVLTRFEERLEWAALACFALALAHTLLMEAQPSDLFVAQRRPGAGVPAALLVLAAAAEIAVRSRRARTAFVWLSGALGLYAVTLMILQLAESLGDASVETAFQRGHTAVSSLWGVVGLGLLYAGLKRSRRELQIGGFVLFGLSLVKLFVYDLAFLSSIARALSFLAVGALILVAGFFYQRLAGGQPEART